MVAALAQDEIGALPRRQNVLSQIDEIDRAPDRKPRRDRLLLRQRGVAVEIGGRVAERRLPEPQEALHVPALDQIVGGIDIDREIEEVGDEGNGLAVLGQLGGLEHVQPLDNDDVGALD